MAAAGCRCSHCIHHTTSGGLAIVWARCAPPLCSQVPCESPQRCPLGVSCAGLVAALGPTVLLGTASGLLISNAWAVASDRAVKAGKQGGGAG